MNGGELIAGEQEINRGGGGAIATVSWQHGVRQRERGAVCLAVKAAFRVGLEVEIVDPVLGFCGDRAHYIFNIL